MTKKWETCTQHTSCRLFGELGIQRLSDSAPVLPILKIVGMETKKGAARRVILQEKDLTILDNKGRNRPAFFRLF